MVQIGGGQTLEKIQENDIAKSFWSDKKKDVKKFKKNNTSIGNLLNEEGKKNYNKKGKEENKACLKSLRCVFTMVSVGLC